MSLHLVCIWDPLVQCQLSFPEEEKKAVAKQKDPVQRTKVHLALNI